MVMKYTQPDSLKTCTRKFLKRYETRGNKTAQGKGTNARKVSKKSFAKMRKEARYQKEMQKSGDLDYTLVNNGGDIWRTRPSGFPPLPGHHPEYHVPGVPKHRVRGWSQERSGIIMPWRNANEKTILPVPSEMIPICNDKSWLHYCVFDKYIWEAICDFAPELFFCGFESCHVQVDNEYTEATISSFTLRPFSHSGYLRQALDSHGKQKDRMSWSFICTWASRTERDLKLIKHAGGKECGVSRRMKDLHFVSFAEDHGQGRLVFENLVPLIEISLWSKEECRRYCWTTGQQSHFRFMEPSNMYWQTTLETKKRFHTVDMLVALTKNNQVLLLTETPVKDLYWEYMNPSCDVYLYNLHQFLTYFADCSDLLKLRKSEHLVYKAQYQRLWD